MKKFNFLYVLVLMILVLLTLKANTVNSVYKDNYYQVKDSVIIQDTVKHKSKSTVIIKSQNTKMDSLLMKKSK